MFYKAEQNLSTKHFVGIFCQSQPLAKNTLVWTRTDHPEANFLDIWILTSEGLEPIAQSDGWTSPRLGVRFDISIGPLQLYKPDGSKFYTYIEVNQLLEQERDRANQATEELAEAQALLQQYRDRFGELP
jgi:hypothetical protein